MRRIVTVLLAGLLLACLGIPEIRQSIQRDPVQASVTRLTFAPLSQHPTPHPRTRNNLPHDMQHEGDAQAHRMTAHLTRQETAHFGLVALTWQGDSHDLHAQIRVREQGRWQRWHAVHATQDAPDAGSPDAQRAGERWGTDPLLTSGSSEGVDVVVTTRGGVRPKDLHVRTDCVPLRLRH